MADHRDAPLLYNVETDCGEVNAIPDRAAFAMAFDECEKELKALMPEKASSCTIS